MGKYRYNRFAKPQYMDDAVSPATVHLQPNRHCRMAEMKELPAILPVKKLTGRDYAVHNDKPWATLWNVSPERSLPSPNKPANTP